MKPQPDASMPPGDATPKRGDVLEASLIDAIDEVPAAEWNALAGDDNPFLRHEFLAALERHGCVGQDSGWVPRHLVVRADGSLVGAAPLYVKLHSYGEFGSDWAWAEAYARAGIRYYPKLVSAIPFTPATGPRLLAARHLPRADIARAIAGAALEIAQNAKVSSLQWLFVGGDDLAVLEANGFAHRTGCQYHWRNRAYRDFDDYLESLRSKRRKQVRRERREANAAGLEIRLLGARDIGEAEWHAYHALYSSTYDRKWGYPSLTPEFFCEVGEAMPDSAMLVLARRGTRYVAGAHLFRGRRVLYGRNWGCHEFHPSLHFEMCYYRCIEHAIEQGLDTFEAGAQGEHKIWRGFVPVETHSAHWFRHHEFRDAIDDYLRRERAQIRRQIEAMETHLPFRAEAR
ncbi:MAG: GNAT family N-acetyltransferase [Gammaproteobacteria bacterium]|nr:GNAT family N-acetyltransferase [Gammaproteobacteria bacterium]